MIDLALAATQCRGILSIRSKEFQSLGVDGKKDFACELCELVVY